MVATGYRHLLKRYARYAPNYDRRFARYTSGTLTKALSLLPSEVREGSLIDIACGTGWFEELALRERPGLELTGVDISPQMLARARERLPAHPDIQWLEGRAEELPVPSRSYDLLTCNSAFHLVQDARRALREFRRVLKPGGRLIIVDWCRDSVPMKMLNLLQRVIDQQPRHVRTLKDFTPMLEAAGFELEHRERFGVPPMWGMMAFRALNPAERAELERTVQLEPTLASAGLDRADGQQPHRREAQVERPGRSMTVQPQAD